MDPRRISNNAWFNYIYALAPGTLYCEVLASQQDELIALLEERPYFIIGSPSDFRINKPMRIRMELGSAVDAVESILRIPYNTSLHAQGVTSLSNCLADVLTCFGGPLVLAVSPNVHGSNIFIKQLKQNYDGIEYIWDNYDQLSLTHVPDDSLRDYYNAQRCHGRKSTIECLHGPDWLYQVRLHKRYQLDSIINPN